MLQATDVSAPGLYVYYDPIGCSREPVSVGRSDADVVAFFTELKGEDGVGEILVSDMVGEVGARAK